MTPRDIARCSKHKSLTAASSSNSSSSGLGSLHLELLEIICEPLSLRDRVSLCSCCAALWGRPDVAGSTVLWGNIVLRPRNLASAQKRAGLLAWLSHHRTALRRVEVEGEGCGVTAAALLRSLGGAPISELFLARKFAPRACGGALTSLTGLASLSRLDLGRNNLCGLPRCLSALSALAHLELGGNMFSAEGALRHLQHLSSLTFLGLSWCDISRLPRQLSALVRLRHLDASGSHLGPAFGAVGAALQPLQHLTALTALSLSESGLVRLPPLLSALASLRVLDLGQSGDELDGNEFNDGVALRPLGCMTLLTRLDLSECCLSHLPPQLSALSTLADLNLRSNYPLGSPAISEADWHAAFSPLERCTALTRLVLGGFMLRRLPEQLSALGVLQHLDVSGSELLCAGGGDFEPLRRCTAITRLDLGGCGISSLPPQLSALGALQSLEVSGNELRGAAASLTLLAYLPTLTRLDLGWSGLEHLPEQLSALSALAELEAGGSHFEAAGALEPLRALRRLTRLGLARCRISALPEQLSALRALRDLDIASNGLAGEGAMRPLQALLGLTRLDARRCGLARLPAEVSALQALEEMDLSLNPLSGESSLEGLQRLTALRHLSLYECDLSRLPPEVSTLPALDTLRLSGNRALGKEGAGLLGLLRGLGALTYLDLAGCGMQGHHSQLSALSGMGVNVRC